MATEDPFAGGTEIGEKDPFAAADDEFEGFGDINAPVGDDDIPLVDRNGPVEGAAEEPAAPAGPAPADAPPPSEGEPVAAAAPVPQPAPTQAAAEPVAPAPEPTPPAAEPSPREAAEQAAQQSLANLREQREEAAREPQQAVEQPTQPVPPPQEAPNAAAEVPVVPVAAQEQQARLRAMAAKEAVEKAAGAAAAGEDELAASLQPEGVQDDGSLAVEPEPVSEPEVPEPIANATAEEPPEPEDAPEPEEEKGKDGKVTKRRYEVLKVTGPGKFEQVYWYELDGKMVTKNTPGAKRQKTCVVRGAPDALKIGYAAVGAPVGGVKLVAVACLHFQVKTVKPKQPEPQKVKLDIS